MISVLYVDDEPALLEIGKLFLEKTGQFSVDIITSAQDALSLLKSKDYDVILSDYQMPEMNGIDLLKRVRISGNTIPVIISTERGQEEVVVEAINNGGDFYLKNGVCPETQFFELAHKIQIAVEHQRTLEKILSLNRLYSVLSASNKAIVHLRTKDEFFSEICRILVETGGFRMAWIGLADPEYKIIRPITSVGQINGYLDNINISTEDIPSGRGPTGTAYREGSYFFSNDIASDPRMELWRGKALKHGYLASAAFPFALGTKNAGILTIYAPVTGFFDDRTITLLEELSGAILFALETLDQIEHRISSTDGCFKRHVTGF
jgi:CheY-like chemotaxis protein